ncbi:cation:proton antiporter domain-containing protein [Actinopolymorpha singaporensis]
MLTGLLAGVVAQLALARIRDAYAETTVTVLVPFVAYVGADHLRGSGVLAVLVLGLYLRSRAHHATTSQGWLLGRSVWSYADFLVGLSRRDDIVVVAMSCVLVTLLVQGLTLAPSTTWLRVGSEDDDSRSVARLRREAATTALEEIRPIEPEHLADTVRRAAVLQYEGYVSAQTAMEEARRAEASEDERDPAEQLRKVLRRATDVERQHVLDSRRRDTVSAEVADRALRDVETHAVRDLG